MLSGEMHLPNFWDSYCSFGLLCCYFESASNEWTFFEEMLNNMHFSWISLPANDDELVHVCLVLQEDGWISAIFHYLLGERWKNGMFYIHMQRKLRFGVRYEEISLSVLSVPLVNRTIDFSHNLIKSLSLNLFGLGLLDFLEIERNWPWLEEPSVFRSFSCSSFFFCVFLDPLIFLEIKSKWPAPEALCLDILFLLSL